MKRLALVVAVLLVASAAALAGLERHYRGLEEGLRLRIAEPDERDRKFVLNGPSLNSEGFRERDLDLEKPGGIERIVVLGDSVTFGAGVRPPETWTRAAEELLSEDTPTQVVNLGVFSYDAEQVAATLETRVERWNADLVVYASYINDHVPTDLLQTETGPIYVGSTLEPQLSGPGFLLPHSALLRRYYGAQAARLETLREEQWRGDLDWYRQQLERMLAAEPELFIYALLPHTRKDSSVHRRYLDLYAELGIPHASALPYLAGSGRDGFYIAEKPADVAHPNATGHRVLGWGFTDALRRVRSGEPALAWDDLATLPPNLLESTDDASPARVHRPGAGQRRDPAGPDAQR